MALRNQSATKAPISSLEIADGSAFPRSSVACSRYIGQLCLKIAPPLPPADTRSPGIIVKRFYVSVPCLSGRGANAALVLPDLLRAPLFLARAEKFTAARSGDLRAANEQAERAAYFLPSYADKRSGIISILSRNGRLLGAFFGNRFLGGVCIPRGDYLCLGNRF